MLKNRNLKLAGRFAVDSGQAMVGDPCYLDEWEPWNSDAEKFDEYPKHKGKYSYLGSCEATLTKGYGSLGNSAVVFSTGYGDGLYPVYVELNDDNRVSKVIIDFEGEIDMDEEE